MATNANGKVMNETGIYKSENGGKTWRLVYPGFNNMYNTNDSVFAFSEADNGVRKIYAASQNGDGIVMSADMGETWLNIGMKGTDITTLKYYNGKLIAASRQNGIMLTDNDGISWTEINTGLEMRSGITDVKSFDINPAEGGCWYAVNYGNIYESSNMGESWKIQFTPAK